MEVDPKFKVPLREEIAANIRGIGLVIASTPVLFIASVLLTVVQGVSPVLVVAGTGKFLTSMPAAIEQGFASAPGRSAQEALIIIGLAILASQVLGPVQEAMSFGLQRKFRSYLARRLMAAVGELPGMAYFEDPKFRDKLQIAEWIGWAPTQSVRMFTQMVQQASTIAGMAVVAATYATWVPALIILAALPAGIMSVHLESVVGLARWRYSPEMRRSEYYRELALKLEPAKEMRIFGLKDWTLGRQATHYFNSMREAWDKRRKSILMRLALQIPAVGAMAYAYLSMLRGVIAGSVDPGVFTAAAMAAVGLSSSMIGIFSSASWARRSNYYLPVVFQILGLPKKDPRLKIGGTIDARGLPKSGIEFRNVSFSYPGTERKILDGLNLVIPYGTSLALVGENGAGKTTLIKLLCRMYDPTEGQILFDGVDITELEIDGLRERLAVIFQDFVRYHLPASDNVGFGSPAKLSDRAIASEAARRVGVLDKIESLPDGWDTPLAREFGGVDLSGGEWQRIALARAIMAQLGTDADILILDEPTASLDVRLEHELYERFNEISAERTTLLVSHRFSTVRMAESIVFIEDGRIVEQGDHDSLMASGGRYAELYEMQASHYRKTGTLE